MKICIISNLYPPNARGGAEQVVSKTVDGLTKQGHDVVVITTTQKGDWVEREDGVKVYRFCPKNLYYYTDAYNFHGVVRFFWHIINMFHFGAERRVKEILETEKPDVVHTHNLMGLSFLIPRVINALGIHHVHTVHDVQLVEPSGVILKSKENSLRYNGLPTQIYSFITKKLFGSPDVVISPSKFLYKFYSSRDFFNKSKFVVVRNPVPFDLNINTDNIEKPKELTFLYIGQVEDHKGVIFLTKAFNEINIDAQLHIVGSGSDLDIVRQISKDNKKVHIHGRLTREEVKNLFLKSHMTIVPSRCYENSPTVIFESFYFGVPVLASNIEGIAELIKEGDNGLTFVADDSDSLKEKIIWCSKNENLIEQMSKKTALSLDGLTEGNYISKLLQLYKN